MRWKVKSKVWTPGGSVLTSEGVSEGETANEAVRAHKVYLSEKLGVDVLDANVTSISKAKGAKK